MSTNAFTDTQGNYSITGLDDGTYYVNVVDMQKGSSYSTEHEVRGSGTFDIDFTTAGLRGRVVESSSNKPVSNAAINVRSGGVEIFRGRTIVTDEAGTFALDGLASGSYNITASFEGLGSETKSVTVGDSGVQTLEFRLAQSEGLKLNIVDARSNRSVGGSAVVFDRAGAVVQETQANFFPGADTAASTLTLPVAPGSYFATVTAMNYAPVTIQVSAPSTRIVAMTAGGTIEVESKSSDSRRVQLIDSWGFVYPKNTGPFPRRWELLPRVVTPIRLIAPGTYTLQVLGPDDRSVVAQTQVTVVEGQIARVEI
jgi:large repetitive protein